jgi:tRNA threonylcarbamoyladenosine biosynthesis protein TsaE
MASVSSRRVQGLNELRALAQELIVEGYQHFALRGDLGTGKTAFVQQAGALLGVAGPMPSPTFTLLAIYQLEQAALYHFDLYRLLSADEALDAGLEEYWEQDASYVFIEWPELVKPDLPASFLFLYFQYEDSHTRYVTLHYPS